MQFMPDTTVLFTVFFDFPFTFTENFKAFRINHRIRYLTPGGRFKADINRLYTFTGSAVILATKRSSGQK